MLLTVLEYGFTAIRRRICVSLDQLRMVRSAGAPLIDNFSILRVRLAREKEREVYFENAASVLTSSGQLAVLLVKLD
jgi:hypothetical protein